MLCHLMSSLLGPLLSLFLASREFWFQCFASWTFPVIMSSHLVHIRKNTTLGPRSGALRSLSYGTLLGPQMWEGLRCRVTYQLTFSASKVALSSIVLFRTRRGANTVVYLFVEASSFLMVSWILLQRFVSLVFTSIGGANVPTPFT